MDDTHSDDEKVLDVLRKDTMYWLGYDIIAQRAGLDTRRVFHSLDRLMDAGKVEQHPSDHPNYKLAS